MRPIYKATVAQIDITSACHLACANCTRFVGHHRPNYFMSLECVEEAIKSLLDSPMRIGIMGGEPTLHPKIRDIFKLMRDLVPRKRREFWTAGHRWDELKEDIYATFDKERVAFNDHTQTDGKHQPLGVAIQEVVADKDLMWELIRKCPFQERWSPVINDKGAYFCEIAGAQARVMGGSDGWRVEPGWWDKSPDHPKFEAQVQEFCPNCSGCLPMPAVSDGRGGRDGPTKDVVSPQVFARLRANGAPKAMKNQVEIFDKAITRKDIEGLSEWNPREFRSFRAHNPEDVKAALQKQRL